jgi:hypothetical protein
VEIVIVLIPITWFGKHLCKTTEEYPKIKGEGRQLVVVTSTNKVTSG